MQRSTPVQTHSSDYNALIKELHSLAFHRDWENVFAKLESLRSRPDFKDILNSYSDSGYALIHTAALHGQGHLVEKLLDLGADINLTTDVNKLPNSKYGGATALHLAAMHQRPDFGLPVLEVLVERGANPSIRNMVGTPMDAVFKNEFMQPEEVSQFTQILQSQSQKQNAMVTKDQEVVVNHIKATIEKLKDDVLNYSSPHQREATLAEIARQEKHLEELRSFRNRVQADYNNIQQANSPRDKDVATKRYQQTFHEYGALLHRERDQIIVVSFIKGEIEKLSKLNREIDSGIAPPSIKKETVIGQLIMYEKSLEMLRTLRRGVEDAYKAIPKRNDPGYQEAVMAYRQELNKYDNTLKVVRQGIEDRVGVQNVSSHAIQTATVTANTENSNQKTSTPSSKKQERHSFFGKSLFKSESDKAEKLCKDIHKDIEKHHKAYPDGNSNKKAEASLAKIQQKMHSLDGFDKQGKLSKEASQAISQVKRDFDKLLQGPSPYKPIPTLTNNRRH